MIESKLHGVKTTFAEVRAADIANAIGHQLVRSRDRRDQPVATRPRAGSDRLDAGSITTTSGADAASPAGMMSAHHGRGRHSDNWRPIQQCVDARLRDSVPLADQPDA